jgi:hypothetical protein
MINKDSYDNLIVSLQCTLDKLNLLIAVCNNKSLQTEVITKYEKELREGFDFYHLKLQGEDLELSLSYQLSELIKQNPDLNTDKQVLVTVKSLSFSDLPKIMGYLQWGREKLLDYPFAIVLWVTYDVEIMLAKKASDFWAWRKGVFRF